MKIVALHVPPKLLTTRPSPDVAQLRKRLEAILHSARDNAEVADILPEVAFYEVIKAKSPDPDMDSEDPGPRF